MVIYKKTKQWFNESCKKAVQDRDKANSLVVVEEHKRKTSPETTRDEKSMWEKQWIERMVRDHWAGRRKDGNRRT